MNRRIRIFFKKITRTKQLPKILLDTQLKRCLSIFHIFFMGIGHMVGGGLYSLTGKVMRCVTGPAIVLSYVLGGISALLSALNYAEMESRLPMAGSVYSFTYFIIGEFFAFLIGWSMILRQMIIIVVLSKAWSSTFDHMVNGIVTKFTSDIGSIPSAEYFGSKNGPDLLAAFLLLSVCIMICFGAHWSAKFITVFASLNIAVMVFTVGYGLSLADITLWTNATCCNGVTVICDDNETIIMNVTNAFMPYEFSSVISGAAKIYFAYTGFDAIASAGEETKSPQTYLPWGTIASVVFVTVAYILMSATLSLLVPYCNIQDVVPFQEAFNHCFKWLGIRGKHYAVYVVYVGHLSALTTVLTGQLFFLTRTIYSMSLDGMLFAWLKILNRRTRVPLYTVTLFGFIATLLATVCNFDHITDFASLASLLNDSIVAICVIVLRYNPDSYKFGGKQRSIVPKLHNGVGMLKPTLKQMKFFLKRVIPKKPIPLTTFILTMACVGFGSTINLTDDSWKWWNIFILTIFLCCALSTVLVLFTHQTSNASLYFKAPLVQLLPPASLLLNILLMTTIPCMSWFGLIVWFLIGILVYFAYSINHSKENAKTDSNNRTQKTNELQFGRTRMNIWETRLSLQPYSSDVILTRF